MAGVTIATHNGSKVSRQHNVRMRSVVRSQSHIDPNGTFEVWRDEKPREAYERLFGDAMRAYNARQTRADRQIKDYYNYIKNDGKKHLCYEMIISIGSIKGEQIDREKGYAAMRTFFETWEERNPNLALIGAYYHADEEGVPHVHLDYIPVANGYKQGMECQTGLVRALEQQGFWTSNRKLTAQICWEKRENAYFEELVRAQGYEVEHPDIEGQKHRDVATYKAEQQLETLVTHYTELEQMKDDMLRKATDADLKASVAEARLKSLKGEIKTEKDLQKRIAGRTLIGTPRKRVSMPYEDYRTLTRFREKHRTIDVERKELLKDYEEVAKAKAELNETVDVLKQTNIRVDGTEMSLWNYAKDILRKAQEERKRLDKERAEREKAEAEAMAAKRAKATERPESRQKLQDSRMMTLDDAKGIVERETAKRATEEPREHSEPSIRRNRGKGGK